DTDDRIHSGEDIGDRNSDTSWFAVSNASQIHDSGHALRHQVIARAFRVRSVLSKSGHRAVDQAGAFRCQTFVVESEFRQPSDLEVLDQDIGARSELAHDAPTLIAFEVHFDGAFAAISGMKIGRPDMVTIRAFDKRRTPAAGIVARALTLNLDHVGAEIGQHLPGPGTGKNTGKFKNSEAF